MMKKISLLAAVLLMSFGANASDYDGTWVSECEFSSFTGEGSISSLVINGDEGSLIDETYDDALCANKITTTRLEFSFLTGLPGKAQGSYDFDMTVKSYHQAFHQSDVIDTLNVYEFMGFNDWKVDQEKDITGIESKGDYAPDKGMTFFTIVKVENDQLTMGLLSQKYNGSSSKSRPIKLDEKFIYYKK